MKFSPLLRTARNIVIPLFCVWHMFAVAVYAVPTGANDRVSQKIKTHLQPLVIPYMFHTSQWQQWNLFSPDPMRRVSQYVLVADLNGKREAVHVISPSSHRWWQSQNDITILRRFEDVGEPAFPIIQRFTAGFCRPLNLPLGSTIRFVLNSTELPRVGPNDNQQWWTEWQPTWSQYEWPAVSCPSDTPASDVAFP